MTSEATRRRIEGDRPAPVPVPLSERTVGALLTEAYALTHQLHDYDRSHRAAAARADRQAYADHLAALRAQRDAITAELESRTQPCQCCDGRC